MKYHVGMKDVAGFLYLNTEGKLTPHKSQAAVYLSLANAEEARDKFHRKAKKTGDNRKLYVMPIRD
jgi:hypothetical protein